MEYRQLGNSGLKVSAIGLGTNQFGGKVDQQGVNAIIDAALDAGINFIDTADAYQKGRSEETLGVALKGKWDRALIATKVFFPTGEGPNDRGVSRYPHPRRRRSQLAPPANRPHRPLPGPPLGRCHAHRRDAARVG